MLWESKIRPVITLALISLSLDLEGENDNFLGWWFNHFVNSIFLVIKMENLHQLQPLMMMRLVGRIPSVRSVRIIFPFLFVKL